MLPFKLIYHEDFDLHIGAHVFPTNKFRLIRERLLAQHTADESDFERPEPATDEQLTLAHDADWIRRLKQGLLSYEELYHLEIPYSQAMVNAFVLAAGGSILAARRALRDGFAYCIGGGFHHAYPDHGEGFCAIHDVAVAIRTVQQERLIDRAMVVDCDVHHGNGTAFIFRDDDTVFTFSIHQFNNYPAVKPPSNVDIHLDDGVGDDEYLSKLRAQLTPAIETFRPQLIMYVAGGDPYIEDQLGGLALTKEGLKERDRVVIGAASQYGIPLASSLAGGYARSLSDTIEIQANTAVVMAETARAKQPAQSA